MIFNIKLFLLSNIRTSIYILAVVSNNKKTSESLNYIIGGLIVIVLILVGSTLFNKKKN